MSQAISDAEHALRDLTPDALAGLETRASSQIRAMEAQRKMTRGRILQALISATEHKDAVVTALSRAATDAAGRVTTSHRYSAAYRKGHEQLVVALARFLPARWRDTASYLFREGANDRFAAVAAAGRLAALPAATGGLPVAASAAADATASSYVRSLFQSPEAALRARYGIADGTSHDPTTAAALAPATPSLSPGPTAAATLERTPGAQAHGRVADALYRVGGAGALAASTGPAGVGTVAGGGGAVVGFGRGGLGGSTPTGSSAAVTLRAMSEAGAATGKVTSDVSAATGRRGHYAASAASGGNGV